MPEELLPGEQESPLAVGAEGELDGEAPVVELHVVLLTDHDGGERVDVGIQIQSASGLTTNAEGLTQIVNLIEVEGLARLFRGALAMRFTIDLDFHILFAPLFLKRAGTGIV